MSSLRFQELQVYRLSEELADLVWEIARPWDNFARDTVGKQLVKAADSIGANIAEGAGKTSFADNRRFVGIARGSFNETQHWLRRAFRRNLINEGQTTKLRALVEELGPKLNAYLKSIGSPTKTTAANRAPSA